MASIIAIVEGDGEVEAVPVLIRRIGVDAFPDAPPAVLKPIRVRRDRILKEGELERYVSLAAVRVGAEGCILILLDANGDCPARLGPTVLQRARAVRSDRRIEVVFAKCEYEAWFLAAAESIAPDVSAPEDTESIRGAKEWLRKRTQRSYSPTADQAALTTRFDMATARRRLPSFDKMWRAVTVLLR